MARRKPEEAAETRRAILASARALFTEQGFAGTATTDVVARAGVTRGALYHHFADKADLFRAVFVDLEQELDRTVMATAVAAAEAGGDARTVFLAGCRASMTFAGRTDYRRIATVDAPAVLGQDEWHAVDVALGLDSMVAGLALLHAEGLLDQPPDRPLAILLFGALTEAALAAARGDGDPDELFTAFERLVDRLAPAGARRDAVSGGRGTTTSGAAPAG
ncbi:MAG TPA: TetR family transcriptional regulator [Acidimicrobiales bacterium]